MEFDSGVFEQPSEQLHPYGSDVFEIFTNGVVAVLVSGLSLSNPLKGPLEGEPIELRVSRACDILIGVFPEDFPEEGGLRDEYRDIVAQVISAEALTDENTGPCPSPPGERPAQRLYGGRIPAHRATFRPQAATSSRMRGMGADIGTGPHRGLKRAETWPPALALICYKRYPL